MHQVVWGSTVPFTVLRGSGCPVNGSIVCRLSVRLCVRAYVRTCVFGWMHSPTSLLATAV